MTSAELEQLLIKHGNQTDKEHIDLFLSIFNELRICNSQCDQASKIFAANFYPK